MGKMSKMRKMMKMKMRQNYNSARNYIVSRQRLDD